MFPADGECNISSCFPFQMAYINDAESIKAINAEHVLAVIKFSAEPQVSDADRLSWTVNLPTLLTAGDAIEIWYSRNPVRYGCDQAVSFACNESVLLAQMWVDEVCYKHLDTIAYHAYQRLIAFIRIQGYPHLLRAWNYISNIHGECQGLDRYQAFYQGRYRALKETLVDFQFRLPAASVIGTQTPGLLIYCLAAKRPGQQVENPRQISAYRYPLQYGPKSPSFSRSILKTWATHHHHLYISGTASIVGHRTRHSRNAAAQLHETLNNVTMLLEAANRDVVFPFRLVLLKFYIRCASDAEMLRHIALDQLGADIPMLFLEGAICREELVVEVEGMALSTVEEISNVRKT
jgi:chorismate lyase/3-hydroxybenzoate synthase